MPFTPSHAVVALPFVRGPLLPAAVAVGAMAPDLPLFVRASPLTYAMTHAFAWLPLTVVLALVLLLVWRGILRPAARELSPSWLAARMPAEWDDGAVRGAIGAFGMRGRGRPSWAGGALLALALAIGVATHIAWDWFTHEGRPGTAVLPILDDEWGPLPGYKWLQYGSSVVGIVVLGVCAIVWLRRAAPSPSSRVTPAWVRICWWLALPAVLVIAWVIGTVAFGPFTADFTPRHLAYRVLPPACAVWGVLTLALCMWVGARRARTRRRRPE